MGIGVTFRVEMSKRADGQLQESLQWYEKNAPHVAKAWYEGFRAKLRSLSTDPMRFLMAHEDYDLNRGLREVLYGMGRRITHRAIFEVEGDLITVLAMRHVAQADVKDSDL